MFIKKILLFLIIVSFITLSTVTVSAQESIHSASESSKIDYQLSYPGLLPDHPLYFLKTGRDRVMAFFISNPLKKSEFDLLQADKRVWSSQMLVDKGKINLAESTFSKAENYFEESINNAKQAKSQGMHIEEIVKKLKDANLKHKEVLIEIVNSLNKKDKNKFDIEAKRLNDFEKKVNDLNPKK
ncbi:MAG TPA: DUF5667 domain-containing protein [Candidatus Saccharimonadales bacterium]|nr:DUF5667 domain-containing protein [Candidatus Saccharimonadales bacterium]